MNNNALILSQFSTVIQLWAGLYLLFVFEDKLLRCPFEHVDKEVRFLIRKLNKKFPQQFNKIQPVGLWENIINSRRSIAIFSFLSSSAVLIFSVFEVKSSVIHHSVYLTFDIILIAFNILVAAWSNCKPLQKKRSVVITFVLSVLSILVIPQVAPFKTNNDEIIISLTLFALASGLIVLIAQYYVCLYYYGIKKKCIKDLYNDFGALSSALAKNGYSDSVIEDALKIHENLRLISETRVLKGLFLYMKKERPYEKTAS